MNHLPCKFQLHDLVKFMGGKFFVDAIEFSTQGVIYKLLPLNPDDSQYHILAKEKHLSESDSLELTLQCAGGF